MGVDPQRRQDVLVPEPLLHDLRVLAARDEHRRVVVTQLVPVPRGHTGLPADALERRVHRRLGHRPPVRHREDQPGPLAGGGYFARCAARRSTARCVNGSVRRPAPVFSLSRYFPRPGSYTSCSWTCSILRRKSTCPTLSPRSSPDRRPVSAVSSIIAAHRSWYACAMSSVTSAMSGGWTVDCVCAGARIPANGEMGMTRSTTASLNTDRTYRATRLGVPPPSPYLLDSSFCQAPASLGLIDRICRVPHSGMR